jgi:hypothetical protein
LGVLIFPLALLAGSNFTFLDVLVAPIGFLGSAAVSGAAAGAAAWCSCCCLVLLLGPQQQPLQMSFFYFK